MNINIMNYKNLLTIAACAAMLCACNPKPNREALINEIEKADSTFTSNSNCMAIKPEEASQMMELYTRFADQFPEDSLTPLYLRKAGDIAAHVGEVDAAVGYYDRVIDQYADYEQLSDVYYAKAWTLEMYERYAEAKEIFQYFVDTYPDHPLAPDTRIQLEKNLIGLSPEEQLAAILANAQ